MKKKLLMSALVVVNLTVLSLGSLVLATHNFSDVATGAYYHSAVQYIKDRGVTSGCTPTQYCPDDGVLRRDMAIFLKNMAEATKPVYVQASVSTGALDPDSEPHVCATADYTPAFPQRAYLSGWLSGVASSAMSFTLVPAHSTNSGSTWIDNTSPPFGRGGSTANIWGTATQLLVLDLNPGTTYRWSLRLGREAGTADLTEARCEVVVQISNR